MSLCQCFSNVLHVPQQSCQIGLSVLDVFSEYLSLAELHSDEVRPFTFSDFIYVGDARMVQGSGGSRLLIEAAHSIMFGNNIGWQNF